MSLVKQILEQRATSWEQAKAILDKAEAEGRTLTGEESQAFDRINADLNTLDEQRKSIEDAEARAAEASAAMERGLPEREQGSTESQMDAAVRAFLSGESRSFDTSEFAASRLNFRDLTKGVVTAGGNTVKTSFRESLYEHMIEVSGVLQAGPTVFNTTSGEAFEVPVTTAHSSAALTGEGSPINESDPAFAKRTLGAYKYATLIQVSKELVDDTSVDLLGYLARQAGRACGNALGVDLVVGNGTSKPSGIVQTASTGVTGANSVAGAFTADNLIDLHYSVISPYRSSPSCGFLMRDTTMAAIRKLKDKQDQYLWQPSLVVGAPDTLLGKPVRTDPNVAAIGASAKSVIFGDMSAYFVRLAGGFRFERSDEFAFNADLVTFRAVVRGDGLLGDQTGAVKVFVGGTA